jgi:Asp-tRNA(Asn)/Glu-tRNA(Gln) amidotransferase C subunit
MPNDPKACREQARRCAELAALAATPEEREHFLSLEKALVGFAAELESAATFFKTRDEIDLEGPYPPKAA